MDSPSPSRPPYDLLVVGGGINGVGIARDAAGRGLSVLLVEMADLASATSQWSTKLVHGGLRYLEHYEFRLVAESLAEREVLLSIAPHLIEPLSFVLPHEPHLRPAWMIRAGLLLYDRIGGRTTLPRSFSVDLAHSRWGAGLKPRFSKGFVYTDARVDDARLVVMNALSAEAKGATIRTRTRLSAARRDGGLWRATLEGADGTSQEVQARAIVNVAGPWVARVLSTLQGVGAAAGVRHVKGSHIVVPRVHDESHAYILQNADQRIVFVIPYQGRYSLIGTTDVTVQAFEQPAISDVETGYLIDIANTYLQKQLDRSDVLWSYSGVRPLYDDGKSDPSSVTRDYVLKLDAGAGGQDAAVLSVYGGKLTTFRKLAEAALETLRPHFPAMGGSWTGREPLAGGAIPRGDREAWQRELAERYPGVPGVVVADIARRHGSLAPEVLGDARSGADLGEDFGANLTAREVDYFLSREWAFEPDDVLWRRTKCGLSLEPEACERVARYVEAHRC
jgi:glycerol-3-phosphate dehydrogenase